MDSTRTELDGVNVYGTNPCTSPQSWTISHQFTKRAIMEAIKCGTLKELLAKRPEVCNGGDQSSPIEAVNPCEWTRERWEEISILEHGIKWAIMTENLEALRLLVLHCREHGDILYPSPLYIACRCGSVESARLLLTLCKGEVNWKDVRGETPLFAAVRHSCREDGSCTEDLDASSLIRMLHGAGANLDEVSLLDETPLSVSLLNERDYAAVLLLDEGAGAGWPKIPREVAVKVKLRVLNHFDPDLVRAMVLRGGMEANTCLYYPPAPYTTKPDGRTGIHSSPVDGRNLIHLLVEKWCEDGTKAWEKSALVQILHVLINLGCGVNDLDSYGCTPLMLSIGSPSLVGLLLRAGANPDWKDMNGMTVEDYARAWDYKGTVEVFEQHRSLLQSRSPDDAGDGNRSS